VRHAALKALFERAKTRISSAIPVEEYPTKACKDSMTRDTTWARERPNGAWKRSEARDEDCGGNNMTRNTAGSGKGKTARAAYGTGQSVRHYV
jgi:hypothetical protein